MFEKLYEYKSVLKKIIPCKVKTMDHVFDVHALLFILLCYYYYGYTIKLLAINIKDVLRTNFRGGGLDIIIGDNLLLITYLIK